MPARARSDAPSRRALRLAGTLAVLAASILAASPAPSEQRQHLLSQKDRRTIPTRYEPFMWEEFLALPTFPKAYSPDDLRAVAALEAQAVSLEGYIAEVFHPHDGAIRVHLRGAPISPCFPPGQRTGNVVAAIPPSSQPPRTKWHYDVLRGLCGTLHKVRVSGWLLYDYEHAGASWRASGWEIHPVTRVEVWDRSAWQWEDLGEGVIGFRIPPY